MVRTVAEWAFVVGVLGGCLGTAGAAPGDVVINEINYAPSASATVNGLKFEYVELYNRGAAAVDVGGWLLRDVNSSLAVETLYTFPSMSVPPSAFLTIYANAANGTLAEDSDLSDLSGRFISSSWVGGAGAGLANAGDAVEIVDSTLSTLDFVYYDEANVGEPSVDDAAVASGLWKDGVAIDTLSSGTTGRAIALRIDGATPNEVNPTINAEDLDWMQYSAAVGGTPGAPNVPPAGVSGDYNNNGVVDAADYVLWRNGGPLQNESDSPGSVTQGDYTYWRSRFGATTGAAAGVAAAIPEPATSLLLGVFSVFASVRDPRRKSTSARI